MLLLCLVRTSPLTCSQYVVAKMLLENGADVNIQAKDGSTALEIATYSASGG